MSLMSVVRSIMTLGRGVVRGLPDLVEQADPIALFGLWFKEAEDGGILLPEAMTLATVGADGRPSARVVLLKGYSDAGFTFFTNYESRKGVELEADPAAALVLHWPVLQRQVRIEGRAARISREESEAYFRTRPRGSRIGAWASDQSRTLVERSVLDDKVREYNEKFDGKDVPLPPHWGGYRINADRIEFWQGRASRLHDRLRYDRSGDGWNVTRLYP